MAEAADPDRVENWPESQFNVGPVAYVHAFGQIALTSAMLEELLSMKLIQRLPMNAEVSTPLIHALNNRERADWLKALVSAEEKESTVQNLTSHGILCCDICLDNRNMLVHALYTGMDHQAAVMKLTKRSRSDPLKEMKFQVSLEQLRKIADEMGETTNFMLELWEYVRTRQMKARVEYDLPLPPLPEKPALPNRLTIPPPPADRRA